MQEKYRYTLVLDLDETLVHFIESRNCSNFFIMRPFCHLFLKNLSKLFEVVVYTSSEKEYADLYIDMHFQLRVS